MTGTREKQVQLEMKPRRWRGRVAYQIKKSLPYITSNRATFVHRIRSAAAHKEGVLFAEAFCGYTFMVKNSKSAQIVSDANHDDKLFCTACTKKIASEGAEPSAARAGKLFPKEVNVIHGTDLEVTV